MDGRLSEGAGRLGRPKVRRAYARAAFRHEFDADRAERRLAYRPGVERSPAEQLAEATRTASALSDFGLKERAHALLVEMHDDGLGYARPAKKDPQYIAWRDLFERACDEDPAARPERLRFFGRLLSGMAETEGSGAGRRLARVFLEQAAQAGPAWARSAADRVSRHETAIARATFREGTAGWDSEDIPVGIAQALLERLKAVTEQVSEEIGAVSG